LVSVSREIVSEEFVGGLFSPVIMHPILKEAANIYGIPDDTKKYFTTDNWVYIEKEVTCNDTINIGLSIVL